MNYVVKEISKTETLQMIQQYHYSNSLPKINKHFLGFYLDDELVGVITLGYGVRPLHTIKRIFPSLDTKDYYEIGRMCMTEEMERNSESKMIADCCKWLKANHPEIKVLFTWADGMLGKVGYVYQASGFIYAGYSTGEMYLKDGIKIHVRQTAGLFKSGGVDDKRVTVRPNLKQMKEFNIEHYKGKQYRYIRFLCGRIEKNRLIKECLISLNDPKPKDNDLSWTKKDLETGKWVKASKPNYKTDFNYESKDETIQLKENKIRQITLFDLLEDKNG